MTNITKKAQAVRMLILFVIAILVLFFILYFVNKNKEQSISMIGQIKEIFG